MDVTDMSSKNNILLSSTPPISTLGNTKLTYYNNNSNHQQCHLSPDSHPYPTKNKVFTIHHTSDGHYFISEQSSYPHPYCALCHNKHDNAYHNTSNRPFKHPIHIIDKNTYECVMQHNALHGSENIFSKQQDHPQNVPKHPAPTHPSVQSNSATANIDNHTVAISPTTTNVLNSFTDGSQYS